MNDNQNSIDWSAVLNCREFWINYLHLSDEREFQSADKFYRKHQHRLYWALGELLINREIHIRVANGFTLIIEFGMVRQSLFLTIDGKCKRHLIGWVDPHAYNHLFRFDEISAIASAMANSELTAEHVFMLLLGYWGVSEQDKPHINPIRKELTRQFRATKLFSRDEITFIVANITKTLDRQIECQWIEHPKWGWVAESAMSLRTPNSIDIPDGITFDFRLFKRFTDSLECPRVDIAR